MREMLRNLTGRIAWLAARARGFALAKPVLDIAEQPDDQVP